MGIKCVLGRADAVQDWGQQEREVALLRKLSLPRTQSMAKNLLRAGLVWRILVLSTSFNRQITSNRPRENGYYNDCLSQW